MHWASFLVGYLRHMPVPRRVALTFMVGSLLLVSGCDLFAGTTTPPNSAPTATSAPSSATATSTTSPAAPTATSVSATPTSTHPTPTATPAPPLQSQVVTRSLGTVGANTNSTIVDVSCPSGYLVAGGGISSGYTKFNIMQNAPISTTTWRGEIFNYDSSPIFAQLQVVCLKVSGLVGHVVVQGLGTINAGTNSSIVDVTCPAGYLVAGGGFTSGYGTLVTMQSAPISTTKWRVEVFNTGGVAAAAQAQVECLKVSGLTGKLLVQGLGTANPGSNSTIIDQACPSGYKVAGGGVTSGYTTQTVMQSDPINTTTWQSEIFNTGASSITAQAQVMCLKRV